MLLFSLLLPIDLLIYTRLVKIGFYNLIQCNESDESVLEDRIDVGRIKSMAEALKKENVLFTTDDDT